MKQWMCCALALGVSFYAGSVSASPKAMVTHNQTSMTTNAYVDGVAAPKPAMPHSTTSVPWFFVKAGCDKHVGDGICPAVIKMNIDSDSPIEVGTLYVDLHSGVISPAEISAHGFTITVNAPGEITVMEE
ncbi:hypothetical protein [Legionella spiritensis]|uniref:Uncharacterized protein n=1 Tax=Legionella spiritensis TaxID=452 RepID=A0A0W0Z406_LEGSP|nr:hypothetical protein [Legionella spiritensis]KTD63879.1 hypothetical protein Lspi_1398 [Legionella spiritensis]SNV35632.1 Uncharacterised protein [Legionella spiritensis]